jgi:hypothetical protein
LGREGEAGVAETLPACRTRGLVPGLTWDPAENLEGLTNPIHLEETPRGRRLLPAGGSLPSPS